VKAATRNDLNYISFSRRGGRGGRGMDRRLEIAVGMARETKEDGKTAKCRQGVGERERERERERTL